jgi:hypothetical protein
MGWKARANRGGERNGEFKTDTSEQHLTCTASRPQAGEIPHFSIGGYIIKPG